MLIVGDAMGRVQEEGICNKEEVVLCNSSTAALKWSNESEKGITSSKGHETVSAEELCMEVLSHIK